MSPSKRPVVALSTLEPGEIADCFARLIERKPGTTGSGKPFFTCRFREKARTVTYMVWFDGGHYADCDRSWLVGKCYKLRCTFFEHEKYGPQIELHQIRPVNDDDKADGFDHLHFVEKSRLDPDVMFTELRTLVETEIADEPLRQLVLNILDGHADRLRWLPGSLNKYFPFAGGWLEHTISVTRSCLHLADKYRTHYPELIPPINRDLLAAGAVLHDIGRAAEFDDPLDLQSNVRSELIGHLFLSRDIVRDAAREVPDLNPELLQLLEHLIVSYLNLPAWGSPRLPLIPESLILHHADDLDAKVEMYVRCLTRDLAAGPFTDRDPVLNRALFKGRSV